MSIKKYAAPLIYLLAGTIVSANYLPPWTLAVAGATAFSTCAGTTHYVYKHMQEDDPIPLIGSVAIAAFLVSSLIGGLQKRHQLISIGALYLCAATGIGASLLYYGQTPLSRDYENDSNDGELNISSCTVAGALGSLGAAAVAIGTASTLYCANTPLSPSIKYGSQATIPAVLTAIAGHFCKTIQPEAQSTLFRSTMLIKKYIRLSIFSLGIGFLAILIRAMNKHIFSCLLSQTHRQSRGYITSKGWGSLDISFARENMSKDENNRKVEGYWATSSNPLQDSYQGRYPFPEANVASWNGKEAFIKKLHAIENHAMLNQEILQIIPYRGFSESRLNSEYVGNQEFYDIRANVAWPEGLRDHYFNTFNILPSCEFYNYVMNFPETLLTPMDK